MPVNDHLLLVVANVDKYADQTVPGGLLGQLIVEAVLGRSVVYSH